MEETKRKLQDLFLVTRSMKGGGCEHVIAQLLNRFSELGIRCTLLTEYKHESFYPLRPDIRVIPLLDRDSCGGKDVPKIFGNLRNIVKEEKPDLVLAMPDMVNVWTALFLAGTGIPVVVSERNDPAQFPKGKLKRWLRGPAYKKVKGFVFQTEQQRDYFPDRIRKAGTVLDNPLDTSELPAPYAGEREKTAVTAARLAKQKNLPLLIEAFRIFHETHPDWKLVIYGEGPDREELERLAAGGAVSLPGERQDVAGRIRKAGMFVLSSDFEGMPNALIEAMAMGLPCVSTDCRAGGPASLIRNGENGFLVPVRDAKRMAEVMGTIADDPERAAAIGEEAAGIRDRLERNAVADRWLSYLESML